MRQAERREGEKKKKACHLCLPANERKLKLLFNANMLI